VHSRNKLPEEVAARLAPLISPHSSILIGLSGGVDSVVLLHVLQQFAPRFFWRLRALHVHHSISPNADAWADFCAGLCAQYAVPLHIEQVNIAPLRKHGIEAAARKLRQAAFARQACDFVALAHHADDQAETLLLQLLRGSGVRGASAMPVLSLMESLPSHRETPAESLLASKPTPLAENVGSLRVLRPLLHCSRQEILDYAAAHDLRWIEDESNADDSYPRNFLRHRVLPLLEQKFPACRTTLARSAQHFAEASELLDDLARLDAQSPRPLPLREMARDGDANLEVSRLQSLSWPRAKNLLRYALHGSGAPMPQAVQLDDMLRQLCDARQGASVCVKYGGWEVHRYRGRIYVLRVPSEFDRSLVLPWRGEAELGWPALNTHLVFAKTSGQGIGLEKLQRAPVSLRLRQGGETLRPHPNAATRTLKNLLQEHRIPPCQRDRLPLLYCGDELVCAVGVAVAAEYRADNGEAAILVGLTC
jgi:tRNA(Ile)-lysidine synthase